MGDYDEGDVIAMATVLKKSFALQLFYVAISS